MSSEDSLKRKSTELGLDNAEETTTEPQRKIQKIESEPNLKKDDVCNPQESNLNDSLPVEKCVEGSKLESTDLCDTQEKHGSEILPENVTDKKCAEKPKNDAEPESSSLEENSLPEFLVENCMGKQSVEDCSKKQSVEEFVEKQSVKEYSEKQTAEGSVQKQPSQACPSSISIKFHNETVLDKYKTKILKFFNSFIELQVQTPDDFSLEIYIDDSIDPTDWVMVDSCEPATENNPEGSQTSSSKKRHKRHTKAKKELFIVDSTPSPTTTKPDLRYNTKFTISTEKDKETDPKGAKQGCFNCGELHFIKDCPLPRDHNRINMARQKLFRQQSKGRYHIDEEQKYSHLAPGKMSNELRKALGLYKNEAPHFIYLMRKIGYPPGWLEEAKFVHSDLEMFDIDGKFVKASSAKKRGLDPGKIVDYPGFNVPFEKGIKDEWRKYGVPPFSEDFSKDAMINFFEKKFAQEEDNLETCDMDLDHEQETSSSQEKPKEECRDSPSLLDLEEQKKLLLDELKDEVKEEKSDLKEDKSDIKEDKSDVKEEKSDFLAVKTTHFGTPILKSNSPYMTLPDPDKFSKDVSPVINFENLPNSTGKYEQMTDVLQKVRSTLKKIQQKCDS